MIYKNLYIIGNGFDLHHDIPCGFPFFMKWVKEHDVALFIRLILVYEHARDSEWWSDFENSLARLNFSIYANIKGNLFDPEYINNGSIDEKTDYASHKVIEEFSAIKESLRMSFQKWLYEAYGKLNIDKKIPLQGEDCVFLSFNYTRTLEDIYGIKPEQICHIHGVIDNLDSMIIGHGLGLAELSDLLESQKPRVLGEVINKKFNLMTRLQIVTPRHKELTTASALESIYSLKKDVEYCIEKNTRFFDDIIDVNRIIVYGFSFSPIDIPYLEKIIRRTKPETHWMISWYSQDDKRRIMDFVTKYNIHHYTMINGIKYLDIK